MYLGQFLFWLFLWWAVTVTYRRPCRCHIAYIESANSQEEDWRLASFTSFSLVLDRTSPLMLLHLQGLRCTRLLHFTSLSVRNTMTLLKVWVFAQFNYVQLLSGQAPRCCNIFVLYWGCLSCFIITNHQFSYLLKCLFSSEPVIM